MKEVDVQKNAKDAVISMGGFAMKMSNRFLIGVPDLLFKLPDYDGSFWEVKFSPRMALRFDATVQQKKWLRTYTRAGGLCGALFFVHRANDLEVAMRPTYTFDYENIEAEWRFTPEDFVTLPRGCKMQPFKELVEKIHAEDKNRKENLGRAGQDQR